MKKRKIYILLTKFPDTGSKMIRAIKGCYYTHASIGLDEDPGTFYSFVKKGFIVEKITRYIKPGTEPFPCRLYEIEVSQKVYDAVKNSIEYYVEFKHLYHYSNRGLILSLFNIPYKKSRHGYFCSQFVAEVLNTGNAVKMKKSIRNFFPEDFKKLPGIKLNFAGNLQSMINHFSLHKSKA